MPDDQPFRTKRAYAVATLNAAIRSGRFRPGQSLRQGQLARDLGLGSTPVREAVLELLARGVLVQESHHSVRVAELSLKRLQDIYRARALLETEAARLATARISEPDVALMSDLLRRMERAKIADDLAAVADADTAFHHVLYRAADNPVIFDLIVQLWNSFPGNILWNVPGRVAASLSEHREILSALDDRDPSAVGFAVSKHLLSGLAALEAHITTFTDARSKQGSEVS